MQMRRYFNKICDKKNYSQARDNSLYVIYTSTKSYMIAPYAYLGNIGSVISIVSMSL
jgi:hypothetical protein